MPDLTASGAGLAGAIAIASAGEAEGSAATEGFCVAGTAEEAGEDAAAIGVSTTGDSAGTGEVGTSSGFAGEPVATDWFPAILFGACKFAVAGSAP